MFDGQYSDLVSRYRAALAGRPLDSVQEVARGLERLLALSLLDLPELGQGETLARFEALSAIAAIDLSLVRLAEGHVDARTILKELGAAPQPGSYGVWAAEGAEPLTAARRGAGYVLSGSKRYASGASSLAHALVTARAPDGPRLFDVALQDSGVRPLPGTWHAVGMASSDSLDVCFDDVWVPDACAIGAPRGYLDRASFWHGGVQVSACWYGAAVGCARHLHQSLTAKKSPDEHALAHLGQVFVDCQMMRAVLVQAASEIDAQPNCQIEQAQRRALLVRSAVEQGCTAVLEHTHRALGPSAMVFDAAHARRAADLPVYVRQHHAERDLAALGRNLLAEASWP